MRIVQLEVPDTLEGDLAQHLRNVERTFIRYMDPECRSDVIECKNAIHVLQQLQDAAAPLPPD